MNPSEVTVIVYQAKGLGGKKKGKHKYNVTFGINSNKARSENEDSADGCPEWNTEAAIKVDDPLEPLIMKVKDKDDILGQITLHMHELPNSKPARPKRIPLQPHKKAPNPLGEVVFVAWISEYNDAEVQSPPEQQPQQPQQKSSTLKKMKGAVSHSPLFNRKFSLSSNTPDNSLAEQKSRMGNIHGSNESIDSTISGFSTMSESTRKKKSALSKLKGAFKKSPALGGSKLPGKNSSMSCMDLSMGQQQQGGNMLMVRNINLDGSQESLASQTSEMSNTSGLSKENKEKKSKNPFKKLRSRMTSSSKLDKSNSQSMHNLAFGTPGGFGLQDNSAHGGSSDSLDKLKASAMGKNFPNKFDLTVPKTLLSRSPGADTDQPGSNTHSGNTTPVMGHRRTGSDTQSINSTESAGKMGTPPPQQKRRMSYQMRSLRDDPRERPKPESSPKPSPRHSSNAFEFEADSVTSSTIAESKSPGGRSLCLPTDEAPAIVRSPGIGSSKEDIRASKNSITSQNSLKGISTSHERSASYGGKSYEEFESNTSAFPQSTFYTVTAATPEAPPAGITTKHLVSDENDKRPEISGISPSEGSIDGGTKITLRGSNLGIDKSDVVWLSICGANCLGTLEYFSEYKLRVTTKSWKPGSGKIVVETQSGGRSKSLGDFTFVDYNPKVEEPLLEEVDEDLAEETGSSSRFYVTSLPQEQKKQAPPPPTQQMATSQQQQQTSHGNTTVVSQQQSKQKEDLPPPKPCRTDRPQNRPPAEARVEVRDLMAAQKRQDPEGMTMARDDVHSDSRHVTPSNSPHENETKPRKVIRPDGPLNISNSEDGPSREDLLELVKSLREDNKSLEADNKHMKGYIDRIINRVIDRCPDVLCVDMSSSS